MGDGEGKEDDRADRSGPVKDDLHRADDGATDRGYRRPFTPWWYVEGGAGLFGNAAGEDGECEATATGE